MFISVFWLNVIGIVLLIVIALTGWLTISSIIKNINKINQNWQERQQTVVQEFLEDLHENSPEACTADGFDDCILGAVETFGQPTKVLYDRDKIINKLITRDGMTEEEAMEFFEFNILGAYVDGVPAYATLIKFPTWEEIRDETLKKKSTPNKKNSA